MKAVIIMALSFFLGACGGGGGGGRTATIYGDSSTTGDWLNNGVVAKTSPTPVELMNTLGWTKVADRSFDGMSVKVLDTVLEEYLRTDQSQIIVIGVGQVDALYGVNAVDDYLNDVDKAVRIIQAAGKRPVLRGFEAFPFNNPRLQSFETALRGEAAVLGAAFLEVPKAGATWRPDNLHPSPEYQRTIAKALEQQLDALP